MYRKLPVQAYGSGGGSYAGKSELVPHFYVTAKAGNISRAAKELYISQPAISKAVKKTGKLSGYRSFKRSSQGVTLTPSGNAF